MDLSTLNDDEFENLTYDILCQKGLMNARWRNPGADGGRDIEGDYLINDISGFSRLEKWYIECKHYSSSIGWEIIWPKIAYAESNSATILLLVTSNKITNPARNEIDKWNLKEHRAKVRCWTHAELERELQRQPWLLAKYNLSPQPVNDTLIGLKDIMILLLHYCNSLKADSYIGSKIDPAKIDLISSISEMAMEKINTSEKVGKTMMRSFINSADGFDWLINGDLMDSLLLDCSSLRVALSFLRVHFQKPTIKLSQTPQGIDLGIDDFGFSSEKLMKSICLIGNFTIAPESGRLKIWPNRR